MAGRLIADQNGRRMIAAASVVPQSLQQPIDVRLAARDECPSRPGVELFREPVQPFGHIRRRIDADRHQPDVPSDPCAKLLLRPSHRQRQLRADRGACGEDEIDGDGFAFDEVGVEVQFAAVLIVDGYFGDLEIEDDGGGGDRLDRGHHRAGVQRRQPEHQPGHADEHESLRHPGRTFQRAVVNRHQATR
jgi:hypothetical protein